MFIIISALNETPLLAEIGNLFSQIQNENLQVFTYGITSALSANLVNNVPMALLFSDILKPLALQI